ncbi:MAG: hypothetical protein U9P49_07045 [Thermodesulfobacteriota bacterium]|nr:hypothetical protein [Thermodesulfobacteriota bacterium]
MAEEKEAVAIDVLKGIAMDIERILVERQRSIDALTLFHDRALKTLEYIAKKVDSNVLKERANLYIQRIKAGAKISMTL